MRTNGAALALLALSLQSFMRTNGAALALLAPALSPVMRTNGAALALLALALSPVMLTNLMFAHYRHMDEMRPFVLFESSDYFAAWW
jgi:hypothetical protein